jgi:hypothetical protein
VDEWAESVAAGVSAASVKVVYGVERVTVA